MILSSNLNNFTENIFWKLEPSIYRIMEGPILFILRKPPALPEDSYFFDLNRKKRGADRRNPIIKNGG